MTISPGLCSITFRSLSADEVLRVAVRAGVKGIEWGGDVHVLPGGGVAVEQLGARCRDAGVAVVSYGSYLGMGPEDSRRDVVEATLDSAEALGAPTVRIWTQLGVTSVSSRGERQRVFERTKTFVDLIALRGLRSALEFHPATLTETAESTHELLASLANPNLWTYWQPDPALPTQTALSGLALVTPYLAHLHTFTWGRAGIRDRRPLSEGADLWPSALSLANREGAVLPFGRFALCEYVRDDDPDQFVSDVAVLRHWLDALSSADRAPGQSR